MAKIYKLVIAKGPSYRWLQLPEGERNSLWEKVDKVFNEVGGERVMWVDSSWSNEQYPGFFIEIYPNIEDLQKFTAYLNELQFLQYFDVITVIGTEMPGAAASGD